jgi:hypothetical protein
MYVCCHKIIYIMWTYFIISPLGVVYAHAGVKEICWKAEGKNIRRSKFLSTLFFNGLCHTVFFDKCSQPWQVICITDKSYVFLIVFGFIWCLSRTLYAKLDQRLLVQTFIWWICSTLKFFTLVLASCEWRVCIWEGNSNWLVWRKFCTSHTWLYTNMKWFSAQIKTVIFCYRYFVLSELSSW